MCFNVQIFNLIDDYLLIKNTGKNDKGFIAPAG